jgi:RHS repeat-associated protein
MVDGAHNFSGTAQIASGTSTVTVKAKDYSGNETTKQYEIDAAGTTTSYTYDANGNLTSDGTKSYFWNALNQLVEVKEGSTTIATFEYDGEGRRTKKAAAGLARQYIYDAEDIVEERVTGSSSDTFFFYHGAGIDEPLARKNSSDVVTYYLADHLGSIVQETNASGAVTLDREYDPWGVLTQGASTGGHSFTGREWDAEIGLYFYRARYYGPSQGRWLNDDPIGLAGGSHLSAYVSNNPTRLIDPFGLCEEQTLINLWKDAGKETNEEKYLRAQQVLEILKVISEVAIVVAGILADNPAPAIEKSGITLLQSSGNIVELGITKGGKTSEVLAEAYLEGSTLTLKRAHIQGELALRDIIEQAKLFGRENGLTKIIVEGAERTTGANPGHIPRPITINVGPK